MHILVVVNKNNVTYDKQIAPAFALFAVTN